MTYTEYEDGFEFTRSSSSNLTIILLIEISLLIGGIYCVTTMESPSNYFVASPTLFFFLLIALGIAPAINAYKKGHKVLVWGVNKKGLLMPAKRSSFTEYLPSEVVPWETINKAIYAKKLIDRTEQFEVSTSTHILVVELKNGEKLFFSYPEALEYALFNFFSSAGHCENRTYKAKEFEIV